MGSVLLDSLNTMTSFPSDKCLHRKQRDSITFASTATLRVPLNAAVDFRGSS
ncbi:hypothetical protein I79_008434 [Cricetulus griseus]|uniref:Uncharacterized protein n=1 Tax=Cricetulus griseus TaxID=10029 RepID=G3HD59_CRIGR|nr:hypothetical protein I79_008434 [Cricetulus griseus]